MFTPCACFIAHGAPLRKWYLQKSTGLALQADFCVLVLIDENPFGFIF